jgi:hypothetical protein
VCVYYSTNELIWGDCEEEIQNSKFKIQNSKWEMQRQLVMTQADEIADVAPDYIGSKYSSAPRATTPV